MIKFGNTEIEADVEDARDEVFGWVIERAIAIHEVNAAGMVAEGIDDLNEFNAPLQNWSNDQRQQLYRPIVTIAKRHCNPDDVLHAIELSDRGHEVIWFAQRIDAMRYAISILKTFGEGEARDIVEGLAEEAVLAAEALENEACDQDFQLQYALIKMAHPRRRQI